MCVRESDCGSLAADEANPLPTSGRFWSMTSESDCMCVCMDLGMQCRDAGCGLTLGVKTDVRVSMHPPVHAIAERAAESNCHFCCVH